MSNDTCPYETAVLTAAQTGKWQGTLRVHANECAICSEVEEVTCWMESLAAHLEREPLPPDSLVWFRAQIRAEEALKDRALRPLAVVRGILTLGAAGWLTLNFSKFMSLFDWSASLQSSSVGLAAVTVFAFLIYPALAEE